MAQHRDGRSEHAALPGSGAGRREDGRLLSGAGRFAADRLPDGCGHMVFVRSVIAAGRITDLDVTTAQRMPGVRTILTHRDLDRAGIGPLRCQVGLPGQRDVRRPVLAHDQVRHVGEIIVAVVADTEAQARDAAEAVAVRFEPQTPSVLALDAVRSGAPAVHASIPDNTAYEWELGTRRNVDQAILSADHVVTVAVENGRVIVNPMEPRAALAVYDAGSETFTLFTPTQGAHMVRDILADEVFKIPRSTLAVVTEDVGGAFGIKLQTYPELVLVLLAARLTGAPVRWVADRSESFLSDAQGRAQHNTARLALAADGRFLGLSVESLADLGAYLSTYATSIASAGGTKVIGHTYRIPEIHVSVRGIFTNTPPVDAYRGAGKPEIVYVLERAIEAAAVALQLDPAELRRRNLVPAAALPYTMASGQQIDSGDFPSLFEATLDRADWPGFPARRAAAKSRGRLAGIGIGLHLHATGGFPDELSEIEVTPDGRVAVRTGTQSGGQGHETVFAQLVADRLGIPADRVFVVQGDTRDVAKGGGTGGSSSLPIAAVNLNRAAALLIARGKDLAAEALETASTDIDYDDGVFSVVGTDRSIGLFSLAARARDLTERLGQTVATLSAGCDFDGPYATFPHGCYVAEVEIDPETGVITLTRFTGLDDLGLLLNPMIARGQIHGGVAQAIGQAMLERTVFDSESGQLLSGSLMDYAVPRARDLPSFDLDFRSVPAHANPLGVKGAGEVGTIGGVAPVIHAALNALAPLGVRHLDMPLTPHRIWQAIQAARSAE